jgi:FHA domain-containing protein
MGVILEITAGPMAGKVIALKMGETVTVGRAAARAQLALPHDTFMSGVHFAVECGPSGCRVQDRKSSNGTFLNGARVQDAMLANGDEIKGGQTIFLVKIVADAKLASLMPPPDVSPSSAAQQRPPAAEPAPPQIPLAARLADEPKPAPIRAAPEPSPPARVPVAEPGAPSPVMRAADVGQQAAEAHPAPDATVEPAARKSEAAAERAARKFSGAPEPPVAGGLPPELAAPAKGVLPAVEEPPRFHAIPIPTPPGGGAKPQRVSEPPAGVTPYIAQKFGERPASRGAESPRGAAFSVMGWSFPAAPAEWLVQEGFGLQQSGHEDFPSSVAATEEQLGGITLQQFVESQISMLRGYLRDPKIEPTMPPRVGGADESMAMDVRHSTKDGRELVYRRIYARSGSSVGVLTVTTLAADFPQVLETLQPLLEGAAFRATVNN